MTSPNDMFAMADAASDEELAKAVRDPMGSSIPQIAALDTLMKRAKVRDAALASQPKSTETVADSHLKQLGFAMGGLVPSYAVGGKVRPQPAPQPQRTTGGKKGGTHTEMVQPAYDPHMYDPNFKDTAGWIGGTPPAPVATQVPNAGKPGPFSSGLTQNQKMGMLMPQWMADTVTAKQDAQALRHNRNNPNETATIQPVTQAPQVYTPDPNAAQNQIAQPTQSTYTAPTQLAPTPVAMPTPVTSQPITQGPQSYQTASTMANNPFGSTMQPLAQPPKSFSYADGGVVHYATGSKGAVAPSSQQIREWAYEAAMEHGINPATFYSLVMKESSGNPNAIGPLIKKFKGTEDEHAIGLTQLLPSTARAMGVKNLKDPYEQIMGGAKYLSMQQKKFGNEYDALRAYNAGPGNAQKYSDISHDYATEILKKAGRGFTPGDDRGLGSEQYAALREALGDIEVPQINSPLPKKVDTSRQGLMKSYSDMLLGPSPSAEDPEADAMQELADKAAAARKLDFERTRPEFAGFANGGPVHFDEGSVVLPLDQYSTQPLSMDERLRRAAARYNPNVPKGTNASRPRNFLDFLPITTPLADVPDAVSRARAADAAATSADQSMGSLPAFSLPKVGKFDGLFKDRYDMSKDPFANPDLGPTPAGSPLDDAIEWTKRGVNKNRTDPYNKKGMPFALDVFGRSAEGLGYSLARAGLAVPEAIRAVSSAPRAGLEALKNGPVGDYLYKGLVDETYQIPNRSSPPQTDPNAVGDYEGAKSAAEMFNQGTRGGPFASSPAMTFPSSDKLNGVSGPQVEIKPVTDAPSQDDDTKRTISDAEQGAGRGALEDMVRAMMPDNSAKEARLAARHEENRRMALLQAGLGIAAGKSPYFAQNLAGAMPAIEGYQRGEANIDQERDQIDARNDAYNQALIAAKSGDMKLAQSYKLAGMEIDARRQEKKDAIAAQLEASLKELAAKREIDPKYINDELTKLMQGDMNKGVDPMTREEAMKFLLTNLALGGASIRVPHLSDTANSGIKQ